MFGTVKIEENIVFDVARVIVLLINHNTVEEKIKIWREKGQHLFFISMIVSSQHGLNLGTTENVKKMKDGRRELRKRTTTAFIQCGRSYGFPCKCSNHLSMQSSLAIRLTNTEVLWRYHGCWHGLEISPVSRFFSFQIPLRGMESFRVLLKWFSFLRSTEGVKFVINYRFS